MQMVYQDILSGNVYYKNFKFPIIGNISMDLCTIDITSYNKLKIG